MCYNLCVASISSWSHVEYYRTMCRICLDCFLRFLLFLILYMSNALRGSSLLKYNNINFNSVFHEFMLLVVFPLVSFCLYNSVSISISHGYFTS